MNKFYPLAILLSLIFPFKIGIFRTTDILSISSIPIYLVSKNIKNGLIKNYLFLILSLCLIQPFFLIFNNNINILTSLIYGIRYLSFPSLILVITKYLNSLNDFEIKMIIKNIEKLISFFLFINIIFFIYQILGNKYIGDYGLATIGCNNATAFSAIQTLSILFINFIIGNFKDNFYEADKKIFIFNLSFIKSIILILMGISLNSRSITAVLIFYVAFQIISFFTKNILLFYKSVHKEIKIKYRYIYNSFLLFFLLTPFTFYIYKFISDKGIDLTRLIASISFFSSNEYINTTRYEVIKRELEMIPNIVNLIIGNGFGYFESFAGKDVIRLGMHSQYSRFIVEVGLIGLIIFMFPIFLIIKRQITISLNELLKGKKKNYIFFSNLAMINLSYLIYFLSYDLLTISAGVIGMSLTNSLGFSLTRSLLKNKR